MYPKSNYNGFSLDIKKAAGNSDRRTKMLWTKKRRKIKTFGVNSILYFDWIAINHWMVSVNKDKSVDRWWNMNFCLHWLWVGAASSAHDSMSLVKWKKMRNEEKPYHSTQVQQCGILKQLSLPGTCEKLLKLKAKGWRLECCK